MKNLFYGLVLLLFSALLVSPLIAQHDHAGSTNQAPPAPAAPVSPVPASQLAFEEIVDQYYLIHEALANDTTAGVDEAATKVARLASEAQQKSTGKNPDFQAIGRAATGLKGKNLEQARQQFFELSKPIIAELKRNPSVRKSAFAYNCSMAKKSWVQGKKEVRNPYYGKSMLKCGQPL